RCGEGAAPHRLRDTPQTRPWGAMSASMPPTVTQAARAARRTVGWWLVRKQRAQRKVIARCLLKTLQYKQRDGSLPACRRGTLRGMDSV
ncbi:hypothetical protein, partial [Xanthomonas phaseoli]|uniref:hypothetical protein n=1 Tax=Xanthomonas phaseoli TaxID=1985254 RepID=UPI001EE689FB